MKQSACVPPEGTSAEAAQVHLNRGILGLCARSGGCWERSTGWTSSRTQPDAALTCTQAPMLAAAPNPLPALHLHHYRTSNPAGVFRSCTFLVTHPRPFLKTDSVLLYSMTLSLYELLFFKSCAFMYLTLFRPMMQLPSISKLNSNL